MTPRGSRPAFILHCLLSVMAFYGMALYGIVWLGLLSVMAIRKEKHGHIGRLRLYNAYLYTCTLETLGGTPGLNF